MPSSRSVLNLIVISIMLMFTVSVSVSAQENDVFLCDNGEEIPVNWVGDGLNDCGDWSDENIDRADFVESEWGLIIPNLNTGNMCDAIISAMVKTDDSEQSVDFSRSYYTISSGVLGSSNSPLVGDVADLNVTNSVIGVINGSYEHQYANENLQEATIADYDNIDALLGALRNEDIDYVLGDTPVLSYEGTVMTTFDPEEFGIAVRENSSELLDAINVAITSIIDSGEYDIIYGNWFPGSPILSDDRDVNTATSYPSGTLEDGNTLLEVLSSGKLRFCTDPFYPPFASYDESDEVVGFDADIGEAIAREIFGYYYNPDAWDLDGDGWTDVDEGNCSTDPDDVNSVPIDSDLDNLCDAVDPDNDNDGWWDSLEIECGTSPMNSTSTPLDTDYDGICNQIDEDDDGDGIADYDDLRPLTLDSFDYSLVISGDEDELNLKMKYTVSSQAVMQYVVIADLYGDDSNSVNTNSEKDYIESALCSSPTPIVEFGEPPFWSFTRWIINATVDGSKPSISDDSCHWEDRRYLSSNSLIDTVELEIEYTLEITDLKDSAELLIPDLSWDSEYWFFNGAFLIECEGEWVCEPFTLYAAQGQKSVQIYHSTYFDSSDDSPPDSPPDTQIVEEEAISGEVPGFGVLSAASALVIVALIGHRKDRS